MAYESSVLQHARALTVLAVSAVSDHVVSCSVHDLSDYADHSSFIRKQGEKMVAIYKSGTVVL
eukprot:19342-Heterococcus_DN1.PRE.2